MLYFKHVRQKYCSCIDVVGCLEAALEGSEVKRSRKQIANQLVKQCLVMDRKELHRKQPRKVKVNLKNKNISGVEWWWVVLSGVGWSGGWCWVVLGGVEWCWVVVGGGEW